uniref:Uncharacterized protein n=1 Tax=Amphimedon queenslandica TaxID=400682 RepID=A0A1X7URR2_AMPQE
MIEETGAVNIAITRGKTKPSVTTRGKAGAVTTRSKTLGTIRGKTAVLVNSNSSSSRLKSNEETGASITIGCTRKKTGVSVTTRAKTCAGTGVTTTRGRTRVTATTKG